MNDQFDVFIWYMSQTM